MSEQRPGPIPMDPVLRFWAQVDKDGPVPVHAPWLGKCWVWRGTISKSGYGRFGIKRNGRWTTVQAHRFILGLGLGSPGFGPESDHLCDNKKCVNPSHVRICSHAENNRNKEKTKANKSGFKGVSWHAGAKKWRSTITLNFKQIHLGFFVDPSDAYHAYCAAASSFHGEFANTGAPNV